MNSDRTSTALQCNDLRLTWGRDWRCWAIQTTWRPWSCARFLPWPPCSLRLIPPQPCLLRAPARWRVLCCTKAGENGDERKREEWRWGRGLKERKVWWRCAGGSAELGSVVRCVAATEAAEDEETSSSSEEEQLACNQASTSGYIYLTPSLYLKLRISSHIKHLRIWNLCVLRHSRFCAECRFCVRFL
jgi:hypothetical protein